MTELRDIILAVVRDNSVDRTAEVIERITDALIHELVFFGSEGTTLRGHGRWWTTRYQVWDSCSEQWKWPE